MPFCLQAQIHVVAGFTYPASVLEVEKDAPLTRASEQRDAGLISNCFGAVGEQKAKNQFTRPYLNCKLAQEIGLETAIKGFSKEEGLEVIMPKGLYPTLWARIAKRPVWTFPAGF